MSNLRTATATRDHTVAYLVAAYEVDEDDARAAVEKPEWKEPLSTAVTFGSYCDYVGDKIAAKEGWEPNLDFDPDEEDEDEDDE